MIVAPSSPIRRPRPPTLRNHPTFVEFRNNYYELEWVEKLTNPFSPPPNRDGEHVRFVRRSRYSWQLGKIRRRARNRDRITDYPFLFDPEISARSTSKAIGEGRDERRINLERGSVKGRTETSLVRVIRSINCLSLSCSACCFERTTVSRKRWGRGGNGLISPFDRPLEQTRC